MEVQALQMTPVTMRATSHLGETVEVNQLQLASDEQNKLLAAGEVSDISQVVVAGQKAEIALQLTLQLRNRAVSAYQEIMRMQV